MNKIIERLLKFKKPEEYMCLANLNHKVDRGWSENFTKDGSHKYHNSHLLNSSQYSNYIQLNLSNKEKRGRGDISNANGFFFDFDEGEIDQLVARVETLLGKPTYKILTTPSKGKIQMLYLFDKREDRLDIWEKISYSLTIWAGSDKQVWDLPRVFRNTFSINGKNGEQCQLLEDNGVENKMDFFLEKIKENEIPFLDVPALRSKTTKKQRMAAKKKAKVVRPINKEASEYKRYEDFLASSPSPSEARWKIISSMIARRFNNKKILEECDSLGLEMRMVEWDMAQKGRL